MKGDNLTAVDLLAGARALIEKGFCKGASARDAKGFPTPFGGPSACSWCASGAICHLASIVTASHKVAMAALRKAAGTTGSIAYWNDAPERTQADVLAAYDRAIEIARSLEPETHVD